MTRLLKFMFLNTVFIVAGTIRVQSWSRHAFLIYKVDISKHLKAHSTEGEE